MTKERDLLNANGWNSLDLNRQKKVLQQILRYFVSPLSEVQNLEVVEHRFKNELYQIWQVVIDGLRYIFIPGKEHFQTSYNWEYFVKMNQLLFNHNKKKELAEANNFFKYAKNYTINNHVKKRIDPFLVSIKAIPIEGIPVGYYNLYDGRQIIPQKYLDKNGQELNKLFKTHKSTNHFMLMENSLEKEAMILQKSLTLPGQLMEKFSKKGVNFISADEYYYLKGSSKATFFPWGDSLNPHDIDRLFYLPNLFGLKIEKNDTRYLITDNPFRYLEGPVLSEGILTKYLKYASFFDSGFIPDFDYFKKPISQWQMEYRPVIRIKID